MRLSPCSRNGLRAVATGGAPVKFSQKHHKTPFVENYFLVAWHEAT
jgi:hypothetical protein